MQGDEPLIPPRTIRQVAELLQGRPEADMATLCTPIHALEGTITPQGCAFERHHSGAIELRKEDYRLIINGLVDKPLVFTYADLERFPRENHVYFCECAANTGMEWAGAQLNGAQFVDFEQEDWNVVLPYLKANEALFGVSIEADLLTVDRRRRWPGASRRNGAASRSSSSPWMFVK